MMEQKTNHDRNRTSIAPCVSTFVSEKSLLPVPITSHASSAVASHVHPGFYIAIWIALSSSVILMNKSILNKNTFPYPILLTTWHLIFATIATQILARTTRLLDGRKSVKLSGETYLQTIVPIGAFFSLSLICSNQAYLFLSVSFIQMLKATTPIAVLCIGWVIGLDRPSSKIMSNIGFIVAGVILATKGEVNFALIGVVFQMAGIIFEATRLVLVQRLLSSAEYKMDPLVSLYYFAPICAIFNFLAFLLVEMPVFEMVKLYEVGLLKLVTNASVALALNISVVFLIGKTSSLVLTLSGVLKDILLVLFDIMLWNTEVTSLQFIGYSIALAGLVYYKTGGDQIQLHSLQTMAKNKFHDYINDYSVQKSTLKIILYSSVITILLLVSLALRSGLI